jgi:hypothetical protein
MEERTGIAVFTLGRQIQDAQLTTRKRAPKEKKTTSVIEHVIDKGNSEEPEFK